MVVVCLLVLLRVLVLMSIHNCFRIYLPISGFYFEQFLIRSSQIHRIKAELKPWSDVNYGRRGLVCVTDIKW